MSAAKPRVVIFRHAPIDFDSRAKRIAGTLFRGGFEPIVISLEGPRGLSREFLLDDSIRVIRVPLCFRPVESLGRIDAAAPVEREPEEISVKRRRIHVYRSRITGPNARSAKAALRATALRAELLPHDLVEVPWHVARGARSLARNLTYAKGKRKGGGFLGLDIADNLNIADHTDYTLRDLLIALRPDILHAHHPNVIPAAWHAMDELRSGGHPVRISYDVRENFSGLPPEEIGNNVGHRTMVEMQRRFMPFTDLVSSVNEPIAELITADYRLPRPAIALRNYPMLGTGGGHRTVREAAGLADEVPLIVYSGVMSRARGMETLIDAMAHVTADAHLVVVTMPMPHPLMPELIEQAEALGVADRIHFVPPVDQTELIHYLSGADVAVHPMPGGSPNHDQAMPNKLFEYLHAGLTFVTSDAKLLAAFVTDNGMGRVFTSNDAVDLGRQLSAALADPVPAEHLRELARRYSWQNNEETILAEFRRLANLASADPKAPGSPLVPEDAPFRPPGSRTDAPHVVLFRHAPIDIDTRAKKIAATLSRGGYRVTVVSVEAPGTEPGEARMGDVRVVRVPLKAGHRPPVVPPQNLRERVIGKLQREAPARVRARVTPPELLPELILDEHTDTLVDLLCDLAPDVLHVHHPYVFPAAQAVRQRLGDDVRMVYDAREFWAGLPAVERGTRARHEMLVKAEADGIRNADAVLTVAEPLADELKARYRLPRRPLVALHYPVWYPNASGPTVRDAIGVGDDVKLLVYSGVLSRARNLDLLIRGLKDLPDEVHLVFVAVPFPHPQEVELRKLADAWAVSQERLHFAPPVEQHQLAHYLSGADVAVSAIPNGSSNHDLALPNKLFEYLHAGLPLVHADAAAMQLFTRRHGTGTVFRSGNLHDYLRAVRQNLEAPIPASVLEEKALERTWQHQEEAILGVYDRLTGFVHDELSEDFLPMVVVEADERA